MTASRSLAVLIVLVAAGALGAQYVVASGVPGLSGPAAVLWRMAGYFTILTNLVICQQFAGVAAGRALPLGRVGALVLWIGLVGIIYHAVLSGLWQPQGLGWWADQGLHTATPVLTVLWWLAFAAPCRPDFRLVAGWMLWPLAYCIYAVVRGTATGFWPYPFLDPALHGMAGVGLNIAILIAGSVLLASLIAAVDWYRVTR